MLQNYGIDVAGDVLGGIVILVIYLVIRAHSPRGAYGWLIASWALSMLGSLSLLPHAAWRGDLPVGWYHLAWVLVSFAAVRWAYHRYRACNP